jgi:peptide/nickel transport system substrate-binding protein
MAKKWLIPLVVLLLSLSIISGCSSSTSSSSAVPPVATSATSTTAASSVTATTVAVTSKPASSTIPATSIPTSTAPVSATASKYGGILRLIEASAPGTPIGYPAESGGGGNQYCLQPMIKEQLGGSFTPCLAESYDVNPDPKNPSITLHLRKGVKFHDGTDFNAKALKWNLDVVTAAGMNKSTTSNWKSLEVIDDYTFKYNMVDWANANIRVQSSGVVFVVSPTAFEKNGIDWMRWNMVGTGPLLQKEFKRDVSLTYTRNPNYWEQGKPYLDGLQQLFVADALTRLALFKSGGADVLNMADDGRTANDLKAAGFQIITFQSGVTALVPDSVNADSPWSNIKVRQAAEYALDRESMVNAFGFGYWKSAYQLNSQANMAFVNSIAGRKYDVAKAKQLLTEAGFPNGFKTRIIAQNTFNRDVVVAVQSYLSKVGIQAELEFPAAAKYVEYQLGEYKNALFLIGLQEWTNANTQFGSYWGTPSTYFKNVSKPKGWSEVLLASKVTPAADPASTQKLEQMAYDDAMAIPLYCGATIWAVSEKLRDTGLGTRGNAAWWEPQNAWFSK